MVLVGSSEVAGKLMTESLPVFLAGGLSSAIGAAILLHVLFAREGGLPVVGRREMLVLLLQAFTVIFLFRVHLLWGLLFTSAAEGDGITSTTPAVVGPISFHFLKERPGPWVWAGIVFSQVCCRSRCSCPSASTRRRASTSPRWASPGIFPERPRMSCRTTGLSVWASETRYTVSLGEEHRMHLLRGGPHRGSENLGGRPREDVKFVDVLKVQERSKSLAPVSIVSAKGLCLPSPSS
jgi:EamA-like transporter family